MAALWFVFRAQLRSPRRLALTIGIAALVGVAGGAVLTAAAGARRTDTAYERLLEASHAPEFVVRPVGGPDAVNPARVAHLPQVAQSGEMRRYYFTIGTQGSATERPALFAAASVDGRALYTIGRPLVLEGRLPHPDRVNEVMVSRKVASDLGLEVGDALPGAVVQLGDTQEEQIRTHNVRLHVVGIGIGADEIGFERVSGFQTLLTPAFYDRYPDFSVDWNELVTLKPGVDPADFRRAVREVAGTNNLDVASRADDEARVEKATNPPVVSLWVFALVLTAVSLLVVGQTIARQLFVDSSDDPLLGALGLTRRERVLLGELRAVPIALLGAVLAFVVAIPGSLLMPIGVAGDAEPSPGLEVNVAVLVLGAVLVLVTVLVAAAVPAWRLAGRRIGDRAAARGTARPARVPEALARIGAPPSAVAGTRFALESGRGPTAVPARSTLTGTAAAIAALVAALTFSAGLTHLIRTPGLWGTTWNVTTSLAADERQLTGEFTLEETLIALQGLVERGLRSVDAVQDWSVATYQTISLGRRAVPAVGLEHGGGVRLPLREGRLPRRVNEVALGASTLDDQGVDVGGFVRDSNGRKLRVVGVVVLPQFAAIGGADEAGLGQGALFTLRGLLAAEPDPYTRAYLVRLKPSVDVDATAQKIVKATEPYAYNSGRPFRPSIIAEYDNDVEGRPAFLAGILGLLALGTLAHALTTSVRRRRRDLAVLRTLGFSRVQTAATVAWQATTVAVIGLLVGIPIGIMGGRFATGLLAKEIGSISAPVTPWLPMVIVVAATVFVANLLAAIPGSIAARVKPAVVLRSE